MMQRWLSARGEMVPDADGRMMHDHAAMGGAAGGAPMRMPGMLTPEQMAQLEAAKGAEFDRLFLTFMIQHHEGALTMVKELFATPASGHEAALFEFANDIDSGQRAEIARMRALLQTPSSSARP
jgi:uncharacterized protein (DUF305 family)